MAFNVAKIRDRVRQSTVTVDGEELTVAYRPASIDDFLFKVNKDRPDETDVEANDKINREVLLAAVVSWDAEDESGPIPVTASGLKKIPPMMLARVAAAIVEDHAEAPKG